MPTRVAESNLVEIIHLGMAGLNAAPTSLHLVAVFQPAGRDGFGQTLQCVFHVSRETMSDRSLFLLAAAGAAQKCRSLHLAESPPSSLPLPAVPSSSRLSATPLQTASSGGVAFPPDTGHRVCGSP